MNTQNKVQLTGRLGITPEMTTTKTGKKMARMSLATHEAYKNAQGEWIKQTQWHKLIAWGKTAELIAGKWQKGNELAVEGKLLYREYTDKAGIKKQIAEVQVNHIIATEEQ